MTGEKTKERRMADLTIEVVKDGNIEQCRELCNELMAFQKSKAFMAPEVFDLMNFDTRMKSSFEEALVSQTIVAKDKGVPIGYVFSTIEQVEGVDGPFPDWAPKGNGEMIRGFYPDWPDLPEKAGCLSNLYFRDGYRGLGLGTKMLGMAMEWLESFPDVDLTFVYISNGNDAALKFYLDHGFTYSHEVLGGFIRAAYKFKSGR